MSQKTLLITLVVILVGVGGYLVVRSTRAPATTTRSTSSSTSATRITQADSGKTVTLSKGQRFGIAMGDTLEWSLMFDPTGIVTRVMNIATLRGEQGVYMATAAGTTTLQATGAPICNPGEACPQFRQAVTVTIVVR